MTTYKDLSFLEGREAEILTDIRKDVEEAGFSFAPLRVEIVKDYPKTLLIRKYYRHGSYQRMITKAAMYCGDFRIICEGKLLTGKEVIDA